MCVCSIKENTHGFPLYAPETKLLVSKLSWLKDVGQNVGQRSKGTFTRPVGSVCVQYECNILSMGFRDMPSKIYC